jgi:hypothetical protein
VIRQVQPALMEDGDQGAHACPESNAARARSAK